MVEESPHELFQNLRNFTLHFLTTYYNLDNKDNMA